MKKGSFLICFVGLMVLLGCASAGDVDTGIHGPEVAYLPRHFTFQRVAIAASGNSVYQDSSNRYNLYISITGLRGDFTTIIIPTEINGRRVVAINNEAFEEKNITSVTMPEGLFIGGRAFRNNEIDEIIIPRGTRIGTAAFAGNNLSKVTFSEGVITIGESAFARNNLTELTIPDSVTSIGADAFSENILDTIVIPFELFFNRGIALTAFGDNEISNILFKDRGQISFLHFIQALTILEESRVIEQQQRTSDGFYQSNLIRYRNNPAMLADITREYERNTAERMQEWDRKALELAILFNSIGIPLN